MEEWQGKMAKKDDVQGKMIMEDDEYSLKFTLDQSIRIERFP